MIVIEWVLRRPCVLNTMKEPEWACPYKEIWSKFRQPLAPMWVVTAAIWQGELPGGENPVKSRRYLPHLLSLARIDLPSPLKGRGFQGKCSRRHRHFP